MYDYDVLVAGAGMSGVCAAVSAARNGCKVCLVEQSMVLGGLGTGGLVTSLIAPENDFGGIGREILDKMYEKGALGCNVQKGEYTFAPYNNEEMKLTLDELVSEQSGIELLLYTKIISAESCNGIINSITVSAYEGIRTLTAQVYIDATGDGALSVFCGEDYEYGDENEKIQAATLTAYYADIDYKRLNGFIEENNNDFIGIIRRTVPQAVEDGVLSAVDFHHPGAIRIGENYGMINAGHLYGMPLKTSADFTRAMIAGRKQAREYYEFYKRYMPGCENIVYMATGSVLGTRETRRVIGCHITDYKDKIAYKKYEDGIMRYQGGPSYDLHASSNEKEDYEKYFEKYTAQEERTGDYALFPFSSLRAARSRNLLLAGRCASMDRRVNAQNRVMGYCCMMGQAAGTAAALAARGGILPGEIDIPTLQERLRKDGIPNV